MKTIRVTGTAQLKLRPDVTVVTMTLQGAEPEYSAALNRASREAETLRDVLERLHFEREELKTLSFHVNAEYEGYEESGVWKQRFTGYRFDHWETGFGGLDVRVGHTDAEKHEIIACGNRVGPAGVIGAEVAVLGAVEREQVAKVTGTNKDE